MTQADHLTDDVLIKAIDDELCSADAIELDRHLSECASCKRRFEELRGLSLEVESAVQSVPAAGSYAERRAFIQRLDGSAGQHRPAARGATVFSLRWLSVAAALLVAVLFTLHFDRVDRRTHPSGTVAAIQQGSGSEIEVDGESFVSLPYSNPDLPMSAPHIVQMQVPVSSLADAGLVLEPVAAETGGADRSVLADVLLGMDGQPIGVHVVGLQ